jgi:hypothetical protein
MTGGTPKNPWLMLVAGLSLGLLVGLSMVAGVLVGTQRSDAPQAAGIPLPEALLNATATHGTDNFAIATGPVDEDVEGIFLLDFLTGDLQCWALNGRTGTWGALYKYNVVNDLAVQPGKTPKFLMVTGMANFRGGTTGQIQPGGSLVYIVDANTGNVAVYGVPVNRQASRVGVPQIGTLIPVANGKARQNVGQ